MTLVLRLLVALIPSIAANSFKTLRRSQFDYFKASVASLGDKELFGDATDNNDSGRAEALLSAFLLHEANASYRKSGERAQWLACSADYTSGMQTRDLLSRLSASPQPIHSSRADDCICFMAHLTTAAAEEMKRDFLVMDGRSGGRVLGMLEPFPSAFKLPRRIVDTSHGGVGEWAFSEDHFLSVTFAPRVSGKELEFGTDDIAPWINSRLEKLGSSNYEKDFFWALEHDQGLSVDDHEKSFGTGSVARAWRGYRSTENFRAGAASGCGHADMLRIRSPGGASDGTTSSTDAPENPLLVDYGQRAEIFGHHYLGDRSIGSGGNWIPTVPVSEREQREACVRSLIVALVTSPEVSSVQVEARIKKSTNMAAARLVQAGGIDNTLQPLWDAGLTGVGQVIQVGDTGVDQYHCLFHDANSGPVTTSGYSNTITTDMTKRKIVQYVVGENGDQNDCPGGHGHGSHCAGSAVGGFASDYAVTVSDSCSSTSDTNGVLGCKVPDYYSDCADYTSSCYATRFMTSPTPEYACDQTCYCTADRNGKYLGTEVSGGTSCQGLIEESSGTAKDAKLAVVDFTPAADCNTGSMYITASNLYTYYWPAVYNIGKQGRISSNSWGGASCNEGGYDLECYYTDLYTWNKPDFAIMYAAGNDGASSTCTKSVNSPATSKNGIAVGASETGRWPNYYSTLAENTPNDLAGFSSIGPTADGRYKPDIVAPGYYVVSANSSGYSNTASCSVEYMLGTSMSTPIAAGGAALVRQYFQNGLYGEHVRYVSGTVVHGSTCLSNYFCHNKTWVSGNLVKAILVNGAEPLWARYDASTGVDYNLRSPPTKEQGFGRVALERSLPVTQSSPYTGGTALFVDDNRTGIVSYETKSYTWSNVQTSGTQRPMYVTLAWNDPPNLGYATATKQLVHDLDLTVTCVATGAVWYGNGGPSADEVNNVERVNISHPMSCTTMTVAISATALTYANYQPYALVIAGAGVVLGSSEVVNSAPSARPTTPPTRRPNLDPTTPPTLLPTTDDTVTLDVELVLVATAAPTEADKSTIKTTIVSQLNVAASAIRNFAVTYTASSRRRLLSSSYTWTVKFDVVASLSSLTDDSVTDATTFIDSVSASLSSDDFLTDLDTAGLPVTSATVSVSEATNDDDQEDDDSGFFSNIANIIFVVGGVIVACALVGCVIFGVKQMTSRTSQRQSLSNQGVEMMAGYGAHQSPPQALRAVQEYEVQAVRTAMEESLRTGAAGTHGHSGHGPNGPPPGFVGHNQSHGHGQSHALRYKRHHAPSGPPPDGVPTHPPNSSDHDEEAIAAAIQRSMEEASSAAVADQALPARPPKPSSLAPPSSTYDPNVDTQIGTVTSPVIDGSNDADDLAMAAAIKRSMEET